MNLHKPDGDQCTNNAIVYEDANKVGYAIWFPQMGGHVGSAVAVMDKDWSEYSSGASEGGCIDIYVWHDGEFPFSGDETKPKEIHICDPGQWTNFGAKLEGLNRLGRHYVDDPPVEIKK